MESLGAEPEPAEFLIELSTGGLQAGLSGSSTNGNSPPGRVYSIRTGGSHGLNT